MSTVEVTLGNKGEKSAAVRRVTKQVKAFYRIMSENNMAIVTGSDKIDACVNNMKDGDTIKVIMKPGTRNHASNIRMTIEFDVFAGDRDEE